MSTINIDSRENPVDLYSEAGFSYSGTGTQPVHRALVSKIQDHQGILLLTGDAGTGKTSLLHEIASHLGPSVRSIFLTARSESFDDFIDSFCDELALERDNNSFQDKMRLINKFLSTAEQTDLHTVLIIDDAHRLQADRLKTLQLLTICHSESRAGLQLLLSGLPELEGKVHHFDLPYPKRCDLFYYRLKPLSTLKDGKVEIAIEGHSMLPVALSEKQKPFRFNWTSIYQKLLKIWVSVRYRKLQDVSGEYAPEDSPEKRFESPVITTHRSKLVWRLLLGVVLASLIVFLIRLGIPVVERISQIDSETPAETKSLSSLAETPLTDEPQTSSDNKQLGNTITSKPAITQASIRSGDIAREFILKLENSRKPVDLGLIYRKAEDLNKQNRVVDSYLLYYYAASNGDENAAFRLAQLADPATFKRHLSITDTADPIQANKWYLQAIRNGHPEANHEMEKFRLRIATKANSGDKKAQRMMFLLQEK